MRRVLVAPVCAAFAACLFPDPAGLGGDASVTLDATGDVAVDVPPDVTDAGMLDASDASEAGYCASLGDAHTFCDDFDEMVYSAGFPNLHTSMHGTMGSDGTEFKSAPMSFFANIAADASFSGDDAFMARTFASGSGMTYAFDFRVDQWTTAHSGVFAAIIAYDGMGAQRMLTVYTTDTATSLEEQVPGDAGNVFVDHKFTTALALGTWTRISFTIDLAAKTCSATMNGAEVLSTTPIDPSWGPGTLEIDVGFVYLGGETQGWKGRWDNLLVDVTP